LNERISTAIFEQQEAEESSDRMCVKTCKPSMPVGHLVLSPSLEGCAQFYGPLNRKIS